MKKVWMKAETNHGTYLWDRPKKELLMGQAQKRITIVRKYEFKRDCTK